MNDLRHADSANGLQEILKKSAVHYTTVGELTYSVLRQAILRGVLEPGRQLRQDALAEALGVSRLPIRSALLQLEADGLIKMRPHRGATVASHTPREIRNVYEARIVLETYLLTKAIETMTPDRLAALEAAEAKLDSVAPGDEFLQARLEFYELLYGAAGNPLIVSMIERLRADVGRYLLSQRVVHDHEREHARLLDFVRSGDSASAADWIEHHLNEVASRLADLVGEGDAGT